MNKQSMLIKKHYNDVANIYDSEYSSQISKLEDDYLYNNYLKGHLGKVLDIGCGTGALLENIEHSQYDYYVGVDISENMIEIARKKFPKHMFLRQDMLDIDKVDGTFDTIILLYGTYSYLQNQEEFLKKIRLKMHSKSRLIIMPYSQRVRRRIMVGPTVKSFSDSISLNYLTYDMIKNINKSGLNVRYIKGLNYFVNLFFYLPTFMQFETFIKTLFIVEDIVFNRLLNWLPFIMVANFARHTFIEISTDLE